MLDEIYTYLICALIIWMHSATLTELLAGIGGGWLILVVIELLQ